MGSCAARNRPQLSQAASSLAPAARGSLCPFFSPTAKGGRLKLRPVSCLPAHAEVSGTRRPQKWLQAPRPRLLYPTAPAKLWLSLPLPVDPTVGKTLGGLRNFYTFLPQVSLWELGCLAAARGSDTWGWRPASVLVWPPTCLSGVEES